ncbi:RES family NAD+ phosphorylase [Azospirillum thermophilum]|uniref:RES protein n=1 Tax=Azospirillum thermophilum TaxID=2202148 RepID=A0A2S2CMG9_9PROT|nr:RES family NAD+ phosphorylase [Azospirillum thermophilum]AWK85708.1 RES protein [Azospirillum thermophilum]
MTGAPLKRRFIRVLTPRWAHRPLSGAGAAQTGGRFNRPGLEALYLSADVETAWAEYQQTGSIPRPGLVAGYEVDAQAIPDVTEDAALPALGITRAELACDWRFLWRIERREPPTWHLVDRLIAQGAQGLLFPSAVRPGGVNIVLWKTAAPAAVRVFDPNRDLPRDASSW